MKRTLSLYLVIASALVGAEADSARRSANAVAAGSAGTYSAVSPTEPKPAYFLPSDQVFPHFAAGGAWDTILVIVNLSTRPIDFTQDFHGTDGRLLPVTYRSIPNGVTQTSATTRGTLAPGASFNILLTDNGPLKTGWASLDYDSSQGRLGAYMDFRQNVPGRLLAEALVPLGSFGDFRFYLPVDNLEGYATAMAIANPASSSTTVRLTFLDQNGATVETANLSLAGNEQVSFVVTERLPRAANRVGTLYVEGTSNRLAGIGFRFNPSGGFSSIPIMNWSGMFP